MNEDTHAEMEFSSLMDPETTGLLVVDIQQRLFPHIRDHDEVLKRAVQAIEVCGHLELPILVTEQYVKGLGPSLPEIVDMLQRFEAYNPIEKKAFSCFGEIGFVDALEESRIETLVIVGIETHVCVMQTALDALDRGLGVFLVAEAIGSRDKHHKKEAIVRLRDSGAIVGSVEMLAFELMRTADHPKFKAVQKVIV